MKVHHVMRIDGSIQTIAYNNYTLRLTSGSYVSTSSVRWAVCILAIASGTYRWTGMQADIQRKRADHGGLVESASRTHFNLKIQIFTFNF